MAFVDKQPIIQNIPYDGYGSPLSVKDGDISPQGSQPGLLMHAQDGYASKISVMETIADGVVNRLAVDARIAPGSSVIIGTPVPADLSNLLTIPLKNGSSDDMIVNGSSTPVEFVVNAPDVSDGYDLAIGELRLVVSTQDITFDGNSFGTKPALSNGLDITIKAEGNIVAFINVKVNEDFLFFPSSNGITLNNTGPKDVMIAAIYIGNAANLVRGSSDFVKITINDNLTGGGANEFNYFKARLYATKVNL